MSRDVIAGTLWPELDADAARHCLANALWKMKSVTGRQGPLVITPEQVAIKQSQSLWIDSIAVEHKLAPLVERPGCAIDAQARYRCRRALNAFVGDFMPGIDADWALLERERLRALRLDALYALANQYARVDDWTAAVSIARSLCAAEPLREDAHRLLMTAYAQTGNRPLALKQYMTCRNVLERELRVDPMDETTALYRSLSKRKAMGTDHISPDHMGLDHRDDEFTRTLVATRDTLRQAISAIENAFLFDEGNL